MDRQQVQNILCQIVRQEPQIASDSLKCRSLLLDCLQGYSTIDVTYLVSAIEKGVVGQILNSSPSHSRNTALYEPKVALQEYSSIYSFEPINKQKSDRLEKDLIALLQSHSDLKFEDAEWIVDSWLKALKPFITKHPPQYIGSTVEERQSKILVKQELLDFIAHIETEPSCINIVAAAREEKATLESNLTSETEDFAFLKYLFVARSQDFHGRTYTSPEYKKDTEVTARVASGSNLIDFITNYPIIFFLFSEMNWFLAFVFSFLLNLGLLKLANDTATAVSRQRANLRFWSGANLFIWLGINCLQSLISGVGIEIINNRPQLRQNLATEIIAQKISSIEQLKSEGSLESQNARSECDRKEKMLFELPADHHLRDSLIVELYGTYAQQIKGWQGIAIDSLSLCVKADELERQENSYYERAYKELQLTLNSRYEMSNDLLFLKYNYPELYKQYFSSAEQIISAVEIVRLAWESFFSKLTNKQFSSLGLAFYLFVLSWLTSLGAILIVLCFGNSAITQTSLSNDLAIEIDIWFGELFKISDSERK